MRIADKIGYFLTGCVTPVSVWLVASWVNVVMHNTTDYCYAWWNLFKILF